ncbi:MAG: Rab family GTPase [Candidatus Hodarchaeota archaeon]
MIDNIITGIVYSKFDRKLGPDSIAWEPEDLDNDARMVASVKSLNLLAGDQADVPKNLEIISFPSLNLKGMIKFLELKKEEDRDFSNTTITLLFKEEYDIVFYKYINNFYEVFQDICDDIQYIEMKESNPKLIMLKLKEFHENVKKVLKDLYNAEYSMQGAKPFPMSPQEGSVKYRTFKFKIIICGDPEVGKTSTILRFTDNVFRNTYIMTMGVNISSKTIIVNDKKIKYAIWDIAGQEKFEQRRRHFYEGADGQFIIFDLTRPITLESVPKWYNDIKKHFEGHLNGFLIGNKADLVNDIKVTRDAIEKVASELGLEYIETSALNGQNISESFEKMATLLTSRNQ